jgi:hypothetical protein
MVELEWNDDAITAALEEAFVESNELFGRNATAEITANKWPPDSRDIVDTENLRDSYTPTPGRTEYEHSWPVDYAMAQHEGAQLAGGGSIPAKPWTKEPLEKMPEDFERLAAAKLERVR